MQVEQRLRKLAHLFQSDLDSERHLESAEVQRKTPHSLWSIQALELMHGLARGKAQ